MSATRERYFDHYLDGKPVAPEEVTAKAPQGDWMVGNGAAKLHDGALHVSAGKADRRKPFLAFSGLKIAGPVTAMIQIRSTSGGKADWAWRLEGPRDFPTDQTARFEVAASPDWQEIKIELPATGSIIHLRVLLPEGDTSIRRIMLGGKTKQIARQWDFAGN